ncbi:MAG: hypothetical protein PHV95_03970 [Eubacteriales bacterium]|nr:hypothetical protein [Eubacteriales bacterium]
MGVKIENIHEIFYIKIRIRIYTTACHHHICHAVSNKAFIDDLNVKFVQVLNKAVFFAVYQIPEIIGNIIINCVFGSRDNGICQISFIG